MQPGAGDCRQRQREAPRNCRQSSLRISSKVLTLRIIIALIFVGSSLLEGCGSAATPPIVGTVERHRYEIAATVTELIAERPVREGDGVRAGVAAEVRPTQPNLEDVFVGVTLDGAPAGD